MKGIMIVILKEINCIFISDHVISESDYSDVCLLRSKFIPYVVLRS